MDSSGAALAFVVLAHMPLLGASCSNRSRLCNDLIWQVISFLFLIALVIYKITILNKEEQLVYSSRDAYNKAVVWYDFFGLMLHSEYSHKKMSEYKLKFEHGLVNFQLEIKCFFVLALYLAQILSLKYAYDKFDDGVSPEAAPD